MPDNSAMTAEPSMPDTGRPGAGPPPEPGADGVPAHEVMYAQAMARFAAMYEEWLQAIATIVGGRGTAAGPPPQAE